MSAAGSRVMWTYLVTAVAVVLLLVGVGIAMRGEQAGWFVYDPGTFYSLLTLHGVGMITALAIAGCGTLWYMVRQETAMDERIAFAAYGFFLAGVVCVIASVFGKYGSLWTMLYPLPFVGATWPWWSTGAYLVGNLLVMIGFTIWCVQVLGALLARYGGLGELLGWDYVVHHRAYVAAGKEPPPPQIFAASVVAIDGLIGGAAGMAVALALFVHWLDPSVALDPLWAKNLTYLFGHAIANLTMYMAVAGLYVGLPLCTKRAYHTSPALAIAWWGSLTFIIIAYFHHLYMDFVQWRAVQYIGEIASYGAAIPVAVVTVYGAVMLVHRSGLRWSLGALFLYAALIGWLVGGVGAVLDASVPINVDLHNTLWVPGHFHTYLLLGVLLFTLGWIFVVLEQRSGVRSGAAVRWIAGALVLGGGTLFLLGFYTAGAAGVPRRYAIEPAPGAAIAANATIGALLLFAGLLVVVVEAIRLARLPAAAESA